ncbi:MAG: EamA family transporter [Gammaproteobacteria bacterium]|nr:EamA family transporter [Gammaproteobacteria bacterium]|tara:strand:+ start:100 stop:1038 length:939 start_codon:yes stop_codon:yes gene_type:complete
MKASLSNISPESRSAILLVAGISIFGFSDNLTMLVSDDVGVGQFHFSRSLFAVSMVVILGKFLGLSVIPRLWKPVLVRTLFMVIAIFLYFSVMPMMAIAEAGAGLFTSPIFVLIFSAILFRERIGWRRILAVVMGSCGVLLILRPGSDGFSLYHLIPVLSGASYAFGSIITFRYLSDESPLAILMSFIVAIGLCGGAFATGLTVVPASQELIAQAPFLFRGWQMVDVWFWIWMAVIAIGACVALSMMTRAYQIAQTSYAAIYEYAYLISVGFFGWAFWGVVPDILSTAGIVLIIFAGVLIVLARHGNEQSTS